MFRVTDGKPIMLIAIMAGLLAAIFAIPIGFELFAFHTNHTYGNTDALVPVALMIVFGLVIAAIPVAWYVLGEYTYGRGLGPKDS
jgi:hypothetical protein